MSERHFTNGRPVPAAASARAGNPEPDSIPTVVYYRTSDEKQETSIPEQQDWLASVRVRENLTVEAEFSDPDVPGDEIKNRPGLQALLAFCERRRREGRPIRALACWGFERFSRANSYRTGALICDLMDAGVCLALTNKGWTDFRNPRDRLIQNLEQDLTNQGYARKLSEQITRSCASRARQGRWTGGRPPYGYGVGPDRHLALGDPAHAAAAGWLFETYDRTDTSLIRLAVALNGRGVPSPAHVHALEAEAKLLRLKQQGATTDPGQLAPGDPARKRLERLHRVAGQKGKPWTKVAVWSILVNPLYTGDFYYGRRRQGKYQTVDAERGAVEYQPQYTKGGRLAQVDLDPGSWIVVQDTHPALVDREAFARVRAKLRGNDLRTRGGNRKRRNLDWPLSGLLECCDCKGPMYGITMPVGRKKPGQERRAELRKYACGTYLEKGRDCCHFNAELEDKLMKLIFEGLRRRLSDPETVATLRDVCESMRKGRKKDTTSRLAALRKKIARLEKDIRQGLENLGRLPADLLDDVAGQVRRWKDERAQALAEVQQVEAAAARADEEDQLVDRAMKAFQRLSEKITRARSLPQVREALQPLVDRVELRFGHERLGRGGRTRSTFESLTGHFRDVGTLLAPVTLSSLETLAGGNLS
jgi:DNA invertase Pin-like site-specific DNA recombinase